MSAIAGIVHFDGAPVAREDLERMSQALEPFGRDGQRIVVGNGFGFVVRTTLITPEDRLDRQPIEMCGKNRLLFNGRLDNRGDLVRKLSLSKSEGCLLSDSTLVAHAWQRWGRDCLIELVGVFNVVHWVADERRLLLAMSAPHGGPLYFHRQGMQLYFATAPQGLFALPQVPRMLNDETLGDLLLKNTGLGQTLYRNIEMVQNSHWTEHSINGSESRRYWAPVRAHRLQFKCEEDAWEAFHPIFEDVVKSQLRAIAPVGIQMSGGLDSAAIAGQAARILADGGQILRGYTRVPAPGTPLRPDGLFYNDERSRVEQIAVMHSNLRPNFVHAGEEPVMSGMPSTFANSYAPPSAPSFHSGNEVLYRRAAADGVRVILTGLSGNFTFTYDGMARLRALLRQGSWPTLFGELRGLHRFRGSVRDLVQYELADAIVPDALQRALLHFRRRKQVSWRNYSLITQAFAENSGALGRMDESANMRLHWKKLDSWGRRAWAFSRTGLGGSDSVQTQHGIELRDPSSDRRLVEFCLALPDEIYLKDGIERRLVRMGMANLIPTKIRLDPTRGRQDVDWALRVRRDAPSIARALDEMARDPVIGKYLDVATMQELYKQFDSVDWRVAPLSQIMLYQQGLMGALAVGQFIRWFDQRN